MAVKKWTFTTPQSVGDWQNPRTISAVRIASITFNFQKVYRDAGNCVYSVMLEDISTGEIFATYSWETSGSLTFADWVLAVAYGGSSTVEQEILNKCHDTVDRESHPVLPDGTIEDQ